MENQTFSPSRRYLIWLRWGALLLSILFLVYFFAHHLIDEFQYVAISILAVWVIFTYRPIKQRIEIEYDGRIFVFHIIAGLTGKIRLAWISGKDSGVVLLGRVSYSSSRFIFSETIGGKKYSFIFYNPAGRRYVVVMLNDGRRGLQTLTNTMMF